MSEDLVAAPFDRGKHPFDSQDDKTRYSSEYDGGDGGGGGGGGGRGGVGGIYAKDDLGTAQSSGCKPVSAVLSLGLKLLQRNLKSWLSM